MGCVLTTRRDVACSANTSRHAHKCVKWLEDIEGVRLDKRVLMRFKELEGPTKEDLLWYLSNDNLLGLLKDFREEDFIPIAKFKLRKGVTVKGWAKVTPELLINIRAVWRAMRVLGLKRTFTLGVYLLREHKLFLWAVKREKIALVLRVVRWRNKERFIPGTVLNRSRPIEEFVERGNKEKIKELFLWLKIDGWEEW